MKTVLAPNAPWPKPAQPKAKPQPKPRKQRVKPQRVDENFERWLQTVGEVRC